MNEHTHKHRHHPEAERPPQGAVDAGSQALAEALRSSFVIIKFIMVLLLLVFLASGFFTVGPQERAIILRFGKPVGTGSKALLAPGLHWSFPYPIDENVKVSISGLQRVTSTVGWYATTPEQELAGQEAPYGGTLAPGVEGYVLTSDANIVHTRARMTYRIDDPIRYVFGFVNASNAVQSALDNALLFAAGQTKIDDILTRDVIGFNEAVRKRTVELLDQQKLGIIVEQFTVESVAPRQLKDAFADVLKAELRRNQVLNDASRYQDQVLSKAGADAESRINNAKADRTRLVADVSSRADQFQQLLPKYRDNPSIFVQRRLTEVLARSLTNVQDKIFISEGSLGNPRELRYLFNREPKIKTEPPKQ